MTPHTVLFDLDSTLCRSTQDERALHAEAFARAGVEPFCDVTTIREVVPQVQQADSDVDFFRRVFELAADRVGAGEIDAEGLARATLDVTDETAVEWRPGARRALERARERGPVGLVTNGGRETQRAKLDALGIGDAFETIVYAADESEAKPSPAPFEAALAELDAVPEEALYVGNNYRADVIGAKRAGLAACWVPSERDPGAPADPAHTPDYTLDSPRDLLGVL